VTRTSGQRLRVGRWRTAGVMIGTRRACDIGHRGRQHTNVQRAAAPVRQRQVGWFHQFGLGGAQSGHGKMASTVWLVGLEHRIWMAL
jgi:hypothetical protein